MERSLKLGSVKLETKSYRHLKAAGRAKQNRRFMRGIYNSSIISAK